MTEKLTTENDQRKRQLLDWLLKLPSEREPSSQRELAAALHIDPKTLRDWKKDPVFRAEWQERSADLIGGPDKTREILEALHTTGTDRGHFQHVNAAKTWLAHVEKLSPPADQGGLVSLSTEELKAMYAELLGDELAKRRNAS